MSESNFCVYLAKIGFLLRITVDFTMWTLACGIWPETWRLHLIVPIFKRGSTYKTTNYRGIRLTFVLSKLAEKIICSRFVSYLQLTALGSN